VSPRHRATAPPRHRATAPPRHRATAPPRHRPTAISTVYSQPHQDSVGTSLRIPDFKTQLVIIEFTPLEKILYDYAWSKASKREKKIGTHPRRSAEVLSGSISQVGRYRVASWSRHKFRITPPKIDKTLHCTYFVLIFPACDFSHATELFKFYLNFCLQQGF
jgi:hypothetical protein